MSESTAVMAAMRQFYGAAAWVNKNILQLSKEELLFQPNGDRNHIYWLYGHIVGGSDIACYLTGAKHVVGPVYAKYFDMGTTPSKDGEGYPSIIELSEMFEKCLDSSIAAIKSLAEEDLAKPPTKDLPEPLQQYFKTRADIITGFSHHIAYHSGQISMIMKMLGK